MKKAYSYIRFSSAIQLKGDSLRRQLEASRAYAKQNNLQLDESLKDIGVSAYTGENATEGALKKFIELVEARKIEKGSILIIESLDRLSRQAVIKTLSLFTSILSSGIEIATLADNQHYTEESINDVGQLMYSLISMSRAHEESAIKARRGKAVWDNKRKLALEERRPMTRQCPRWLTVSKDMKTFLVNEERVEIIRDIFNLSIAGMGQRKIASRLNETGIKPFTKKGMWNSTYIRALIKNRALLGEFQPKHRGMPVGEVIPDFYPAVIDEELFYRAQTASSKRLSPSSAGRKGPTFSNIFTGICKCAHCGSTFRLIKSKDTSYLTCSNNYMRAGCECATRWRYRFVENAILLKLSASVHWFSNIEDSKNSRQILEEQVNALKGKLAEKQKIVGRFADLFTTVDDSMFGDARARYGKAMQDMEAVEDELKQAIEKLASYTPQHVRDEQLEKSLSLLKTESNQEKVYELRVRVNAQLKEAGLTLLFNEQEISFITTNSKDKTHLMDYESQQFDCLVGEMLAESIIKIGKDKIRSQ